MSSKTRTAIVTGSNKGIGFHIALQLAKSNLFSNIILACRDEKRGLEAQEFIQNELLSSSSSSYCNVSYEPLIIGNESSHDQFTTIIQQKYNNKVDVLINNAAIAYKEADPTPFQQQCKPTLDINFYGTVDFTEKMIPFLRNGEDARIVNVASMAGRLGQIKNLDLRNKFMDDNLSKEQLLALVNEFQNDVLSGTHIQKGWGKSNYGMSKLALIAMTKIWAREETNINTNDSKFVKVNCCCPGYCDTDMTSHKGTRPPSEGAKNAVLPATMDVSICPTGEIFANYEVSNWNW